MTAAGIFLTHQESPRIRRHFERLVEESGPLITWHFVLSRDPFPRPDAPFSYPDPAEVLPARYAAMDRARRRPGRLPRHPAVAGAQRPRRRPALAVRVRRGLRRALGRPVRSARRPRRGSAHHDPDVPTRAAEVAVVAHRRRAARRTPSAGCAPSTRCAASPAGPRRYAAAVADPGGRATTSSSCRPSQGGRPAASKTSGVRARSCRPAASARFTSGSHPTAGRPT